MPGRDLVGQHARGASRVDVRRLIPVELELPETELRRTERELLVLASPLRPLQPRRIQLVGAVEPQVQAVEEQALGHAPVLLEFWRLAVRGAPEEEPDPAARLARHP